MGIKHSLGTVALSDQGATVTATTPKRFVTLHPLFDLYSPQLKRRALSRLTQELKEGRVWPTPEEKEAYNLDRLDAGY